MSVISRFSYAVSSLTIATTAVALLGEPVYEALIAPDAAFIGENGLDGLNTMTGRVTEWGILKFDLNSTLGEQVTVFGENMSEPLPLVAQRTYLPVMPCVRIDSEGEYSFSMNFTEAAEGCFKGELPEHLQGRKLEPVGFRP